LIAPPPDIGSTRTTRGGAAAAPGGLSPDGVFVGCVVAAQPASEISSAAFVNARR